MPRNELYFVTLAFHCSISREQQLIGKFTVFILQTWGNVA